MTQFKREMLQSSLENEMFLLTVAERVLNNKIKAINEGTASQDDEYNWVLGKVQTQRKKIREIKRQLKEER